MKINDNKELVFTWDDFWRYCEIIAQAITQSGKSYSQVVAIVRGGFYLGHYLSRRLNLPMAVLVAQSYSQNQQQNELSIGNLSYLHPPQGKILLVDDLLDTGVTMTKIKQQLETNWNVEIDTAVIWQKSQCQYQANYYYSITPQGYWIVQPFEIDLSKN